MFNKRKIKICYSIEDIQTYYGEQPEVAASPQPTKISPYQMSKVVGSSFLCQQQYEQNVKGAMEGKSGDIEKARDIDVVCGRGRGNFVSRCILS